MRGKAGSSGSREQGLTSNFTCFLLQERSPCPVRPVEYRPSSFPHGASGRNSAQSLDQEDPRRRAWQPTPVFLPGKSHGQRSLMGYSPRGHRGRHDWAPNTVTFLPIQAEASAAWKSSFPAPPHSPAKKKDML